MIDLHTHTYYSDGTLSPRALAAMAKERGIDTLAITDHDGVDGLAEGRAAAEALGIRFIDGVELSARLLLEQGREEPAYAYMHILGYGIHGEFPPLLEKLNDIRERRRQRNAKMLSVLADMGYALDRRDIQVYPEQEYVGKPNFARALAKRGYAADTAEAFASERMMAAPGIKAIHREKIEAEEAILLIGAAGGQAVLAHPMKVAYKGRSQEDREAFFARLAHIAARLKEFGLSGMECCYSAHTQEETLRLWELAGKLELFSTAGSDYHGPGMKKGVRLGEPLYGWEACEPPDSWL